MSDVEEVAGMTVLAGPIADVDGRDERTPVPVRRTDPLLADWKEVSSPDGWGVNYVYDFGAYRLLARELTRWADHVGGDSGELLRRRAAWLRSDKVPEVTA